MEVTSLSQPIQSFTDKTTIFLSTFLLTKIVKDLGTRGSFKLPKTLEMLSTSQSVTRLLHSEKQHKSLRNQNAITLSME